MKFSDMPYERIEIEVVKSQFENLFKNLVDAKSGEEQFEVHKQFYKLTDDVATMVTLAEIRHDIDTTDEYYEKEQDYYDNILPLIEQMILDYQIKLYESPYRDYLEQKIGIVAFKNIELQIKSMNEKIIPFMQEENSLVSKYSKIIATAKIDFQGEELNISLLRKYLVSPDRQIRKEACEKLSDYFMSVTDEIDDIFDKLVKNRTKQAQMMGYENYVELGYYRMNRNCYDQDMVHNFREQVKQVLVPFVEKIHEDRRIRLGLDKLMAYDEEVYFVNGNPEPIGTPEEILKSGQKMYSELSKETKEFFDYMMENQLFDVLGRKNKRAGGYMTYLPNYKSPFIFANFNSTSSDVDVITHECGHAFQGYVMRNDPINEARDITMETAEIHSMSMEYFAYGWMKEFFGERSEDYLKMHLEDSIIFIPYGCMVDEFQHIVYSSPDMTPAERKATWTILEKTYKPHLDFGEDLFFGNGGYWQKQQHIFNSPFYYIDYCLAQVCAMQFKVKMDEDFADAWERYCKLCNLSAKDFFTNLIKKIDLDNPFGDECIKNLVKYFNKKIFN